MSFKVRRFKSDKVLGTFATREAAESFVDDYVTEHGGVLMIEEEPGPKCSECNGTGELTVLGGDWGKTPDSVKTCWKCKGTGAEK